MAMVDSFQNQLFINCEEAPYNFNNPFDLDLKQYFLTPKIDGPLQILEPFNHSLEKLNLEQQSNYQFQLFFNQNTTSTKNKTKSFLTKNVCYNVCQKTIKFLKKKTYHSKLLQFCQLQQCNAEHLIHFMLKRKRQLTGPKALQNFVDQNTPESRIYSAFMAWFLQEKYLRHAILEGEMKNLSSYIEYKNTVLMNILAK